MSVIQQQLSHTLIQSGLSPKRWTGCNFQSRGVRLRLKMENATACTAASQEASHALVARVILLVLPLAAVAGSCQLARYLFYSPVFFFVSQNPTYHFAVHRRLAQNISIY